MSSPVPCSPESPSARPSRGYARLGLVAALMTLPPFVACATGATEDSDGGPTATGDGGRSDVTSGGDGGTQPDGFVEDTSPGVDAPCGTGSQCCSAAQCPNTPHVKSTACRGGSCTISACVSGWYDVDASYMTGCNCQAAGEAGTSCATATTVPSLALGGKTTLTGNLPTADDENWYQITFGGAATSKTYHPSISLTKNTSKEFVFDVTSDCSGSTLSCADLDAATSVTTWEEFWTPDSGMETPLPPVGVAGVVLVKVHRARTTTSCDTYELTVSD